MHGVRTGLALVMPIAVLAALIEPSAAGAHVRTGRVAVDYRASVSPLGSPSAGAIVVRVYESDLAIGLTLERNHQVVVLGYVGEPFLRIGTRGVEMNESSATAAGLGLLKGAPKGGAAVPDWRLRSTRRSLIWHDARVRGLPRGVERRRWTVPLVVDGRHTRVNGEIWRVGAPSPWPWLGLGAVFLAFTALLLARRRQPLLRTAAIVLGVLTAAVTIPTEAGFALASTASEGAWLEGANVLAFTLAGLAFVVFGSRDARALAGGALGLLGLAVGLSKLPVLLHGVVLSALPDFAARAGVVLQIGAGAAATAIGLVVFFDVLEHYEEPAGLEYPL